MSINALLLLRKIRKQTYKVTAEWIWDCKNTNVVKNTSLCGDFGGPDLVRNYLDIPKPKSVLNRKSHHITMILK